MHQLITSVDGFAVYGTTIILAVLVLMWVVWMVLGSRLTRLLAILFGCKVAKKAE